MGINVYVTRRVDPLELEGPAITRQEWEEVVLADPDLALRRFPHKTVHEVLPVCAEWRSYSNEAPAWFYLHRGNITTKGVNDALLGKLRVFASKLNARIITEHGDVLT